MKNKKGFTLIEVLSVIVILSVIMTIAASSVMNLTKKSKENLYCTKLTMIESLAKSYALKYEKELYKNGITLIAGVDEAGRGPLAGPVVAGAVILPKNYSLEGLNDSKQLSEKKREEYFEILQKEALSIGVGIVSASEIDEINILEASRKAMYIALNNLDITPEYILSDAMSLNDIDIPSRPIIHGDALSLSIAAASVIAKVTRDHIMYELDKEHPEYNFKMYTF